jgi:hypothetical protein
VDLFTGSLSLLIVFGANISVNEFVGKIRVRYEGDLKSLTSNLAAFSSDIRHPIRAGPPIFTDRKGHLDMLYWWIPFCADSGSRLASVRMK